MCFHMLLYIQCIKYIVSILSVLSAIGFYWALLGAIWGLFEFIGRCLSVLGASLTSSAKIGTTEGSPRNTYKHLK